jgi:hypothetical protein
LGLNSATTNARHKATGVKARKTKMDAEIRWQLQLLRVNPSKLHEEKHRSQRVKPEKQQWMQNKKLQWHLKLLRVNSAKK